jgi:hypothetical protein
MIFLGTTSAHAAILFAEDFDDIDVSGGPVNLTTATPGNSFSNDVGVGSSDTVQVANAGTPFGTATNYLDFNESDNDNVASSVEASVAISSSIFQVSFDFFDLGVPESEENPANVGTRVVISNGDTQSGTTQMVSLSLQNGAIRLIGGNGGTSHPIAENAYTMNTMHHFDIVANNSPNSVNYGAGQSVASMAYDVYLDGVLLTAIDGVAFSEFDFRNDHSETTEFGIIGISNSWSGHAYFDNFRIVSPVPEPSALICCVLALCGYALSRCRR